MSTVFQLKGQSQKQSLDQDDFIKEDEQEDDKFKKANQRFLNIISSDFDALNYPKNEFPQQWLKSEIVQSCEKLVYLSIFYSESSFYLYGVLEICESIIKCKNLRQLELGFYRNDINTNFAKEIGEAISQCQLLEKINLSFFRNYILAQGVEELCSQISKCKLTNEISLEFGRIGIEFEDETSIIGSELPNCQQIRLFIIDIQAIPINYITSKLFCEQLKKFQVFLLFLSLKAQIDILEICQTLQEMQNLNSLFFDLEEIKTRDKIFIKSKIKRKCKRLVHLF